MAAWERRALEHGRAGSAYFAELLDLRSHLRSTLAALIGAPEASVALTSSTTEGCNIVVAGLRLRPGDEVVTTDVEHPGLLGGLRSWELDVRVARVRARPASQALAALEAELTPKTRLVALSHVAWTTGAALPVAELSRRGMPVLVDGAQAAGAIPVDVEALGCDFYTVSGQKWLLGPDSTGCLYVRSDRIEELRLSSPSYLSWEDPKELEPWPNARRFESTWLPPGSTAGLVESIAFALEVGDQRFERARAATERCRELLQGRAEVVTEPGQGTLVSFRTEEPTADVVQRLDGQGVVVRDLPGLGWVRASCGFWTSEEDLERLVAGL
ncbi:MAG: aminotransferase class V-fold PLP-dependent enzyme [Actinomycetota bacterium]|nr:aminotransferase class V-fold PLP-dependent enzyme [Actinomycetota bacterium]